VALDVMAFEAIRPLWNNVLMINSSDKLTFMKVCLLKQAILEVLLNCGYEVTTFDADTVFFKNPSDLLMKQIVGYDFAFSHDSEFFPTKFDPNIGCYTVAPSNLTSEIVTTWSSITRNIPQRKFCIALDQVILRNLLKSGQIMHPPFTSRFVMTGLRRVSADRPVLIRHSEGEDMSSICQFQRMKHDIPAQMKNSTPYVMHLACLVGVDKKLAFMRCAGYALIRKEGQCGGQITNITFSKLLSAVRFENCQFGSS
jgi:hypothetical protein